MLTLDTLNWEAVATFTAGFAAVVGAVYVGRKQTLIQSRQLQLEEIKQRSDLFDKRFATYDLTADFLLNVHEYMSDPDHKKLGRWLIKFRESQFLFGSTVHKQLNEIFDKANNFHANAKLMYSDPDGRPLRLAKSSKIELELMEWLSQRLATVHEIFEPYLQLTIPQAGRRWRWRWRSPEKRRG